MRKERKAAKATSLPEASQMVNPPHAKISKEPEKQKSPEPQAEAQKSKEEKLQIGERKDSTGSIPVALRDMPVQNWMKIEADHAPKAKLKLEKGSQQGAKQGPGGVFGAVDVALPLKPPILQYPLNTGSGQAQKNIVGLRRMTKLAKEAKEGKEGGRKCIVYGMGIAEESDFEQMMGRAGCETHGFDCTVDFE